jgi:hypothetical protein
MASQGRYPNADTATAGWQYSGLPMWSQLRDSSDSTYIAAVTASTAYPYCCTVGAFDLPSQATDISVTVYFRIGPYGSYSTYGHYDAQLIISSTISTNGASQACSGSFVTKSTTWNTNPVTGVAWTVADINGTGANPLSGLALRTSDITNAAANQPSGLVTELSVFVSWTACVPDVTISSVDAISATSSTGHGNVTNDGGETVTARGIRWSPPPSPPDPPVHHDVASGSGTGTFAASFTELDPDTTYYVQAYATNSKGTAYSSSIEITTNPIYTGSVTIAATSACGESSKETAPNTETIAAMSAFSPASAATFQEAFTDAMTAFFEFGSPDANLNSLLALTSELSVDPSSLANQNISLAEEQVSELDASATCDPFDSSMAIDATASDAHISTFESFPAHNIDASSIFGSSSLFEGNSPLSLLHSADFDAWGVIMGTQYDGPLELDPIVSNFEASAIISTEYFDTDEYDFMSAFGGESSFGSSPALPFPIASAFGAESVFSSSPAQTIASTSSTSASSSQEAQSSKEIDFAETCGAEALLAKGLCDFSLSGTAHLSAMGRIGMTLGKELTMVSEFEASAEIGGVNTYFIVAGPGKIDDKATEWAG